MQLRPVSSSHYRLPQRPQQPVESRRASDVMPAEPVRIPTNTESDNARREYYYSRVEAVVGRVADALKSYTEIEDNAGRERLQAQLGLDLYV